MRWQSLLLVALFAGCFDSTTTSSDSFPDDGDDGSQSQEQDLENRTRGASVQTIPSNETSRPADGGAEPAGDGGDAAQDDYPAGYRLGVVIVEAEFTAAWTQEHLSAWNVAFNGGERNVVLELQQDVGRMPQLRITLGSCADFQPMPSSNWTTHVLCERTMGPQRTQLQIQVLAPEAPPIATGRFILRADLPLEDIGDGDGKPDDFHYTGSVELMDERKTIDFEFGTPVPVKSAHLRAWLEGDQYSPLTAPGSGCYTLKGYRYDGREYMSTGGGNCEWAGGWSLHPTAGWQLGPRDVMDLDEDKLCICVYKLTIGAHEQPNELFWDLRVEY